jgi:PiT family inorganic phosphate transporter
MTPLLFVGLLLGLYMAFAIGANDAANSMGTSVGSKALTLFRALVLCAVFEFLGSVLVGKHVAETIRSGILDVSAFAANPHDLALGMAAALLAAAIWLHVTSLLGLPVSTTHSIVGAVLGAGIFSIGWKHVHWEVMGKIVISWFASPTGGCLFSLLIFLLIRWAVLERREPHKAVVRWTPVFSFAVFFIIALSAIYKGMPRLGLDKIPLARALAIAAGIGALAGFVAWAFVFARRGNGSTQDPERVFAGLQILTACMMAFSHGANDVANAVGPLAALWAIEHGELPGAKVAVPIELLVLGGAGITLGLFVLGRHVIETVGRRITGLTPSRGFAAEFACATVVLVFSKIGVPISTTHTIVGCVIGVGLARGISALDLRMVGKIIAAWFIDIPAVALATGLFYWLGKAAGL